MGCYNAVSSLTYLWTNVPYFTARFGYHDENDFNICILLKLKEMKDQLMQPFEILQLVHFMLLIYLVSDVSPH